MSKYQRANDYPLVLLKKGDTFQCGRGGRITGTILDVSDLTKKWYGSTNAPKHGDHDPECAGYIYKLDTDVIVYKMVNRRTGPSTPIRLLIPAGTRIRAGFRPRRYSHYADNNCSYKCRAEKAVVLPFAQPENNARSQHCHDFEYVAGLTVRPEMPFNNDPGNQCASGIHFFFTLNQAKKWG